MIQSEIKERVDVDKKEMGCCSNGVVVWRQVVEAQNQSLNFECSVMG